MENLVKLQSLELSDEADSPSSQALVEKLRAEIPPQILGHYDRMMARGKKGVALVRNGVCRECHMGIAIGVMQTLRHGDDIQLCGNCGRYLCLEDEASQAAAPPPPPARGKRKTKPRATLNAA